MVLDRGCTNVDSWLGNGGGGDDPGGGWVGEGQRGFQGEKPLSSGGKRTVCIFNPGKMLTSYMLLLMSYLKSASSSWLHLSVCLLDCGWYPEVRLDVASRVWQKAFHTWERMRGYHEGCCGGKNRAISLVEQSQMQTEALQRDEVSSLRKSIYESKNYWITIR